MNLYIREHDDYRTGTEITVYDKEELKLYYESESEDEEENINNKSDATDDFDKKLGMDEDMLDIITINNIIKDTYVVYLICGRGYYQSDHTSIIHIINQNNKEDAKNILLHLYSDINEQQPFVTTGHTSSYKETGYYP